MKGRVKSFNEVRGFGFIEVLDSDDSPEVFVHYSNIESPSEFKTLKAGDIVEFDIYDSPGHKRHEARSVRILA